MGVDFKFFMPLAKLDEEKRTVSGYASTPAKDSDGEIVTLDAVKAALPDYMAWGNIREMHKLSAVGTAQEANIDGKGLYVTAKIVDDAAWKKCKEGVYKGFSVGGRKLDKQGNKITEIELTEISVVDRPANSECSFRLAKSAKAVDDAHPGYLLKTRQRTPEQKAIAKLAKVVGNLAKSGPPAAHDGFSLPAKKANDSPKDPDDENNKAVQPSTEDADMEPAACERHNKVGCKKCAIVKRMSTECEAHGKVGCEKCAFGKKKKPKDDPYGDVKYADEGLQADGKKRYPIDTEEHIRAAWNYINKPTNAAKYGDKAGGVKAKIVAAWKSKIDSAGPPSAKVAKAAGKPLTFLELLGAEDDTNNISLELTKAAKPPRLVVQLPPELELGKAAGAKTLAKGMSTAGSLSYVFDNLRDVQRRLIVEGKREGGDGKDLALAKRLGSIAKEIAEVIGQKAEHEGGEALDMTDADDMYIQRLLGDGPMSETTMFNYAEGSDPLEKAVVDLLRKATAPSPSTMMKAAEDEVKKARKAMKMAKAAIADAHAMHKAAYLAKMAKAEKKGKKDGEDDDNMDKAFDHAGAMEKLNKAYGEIDKARTFDKAALGKLAKMAGRAGQKGQEINDPVPGVYQPWPNVHDKTQAELSEGAPPYPTDGSPYKRANAGGSTLQKYAKNGQISAEVAELLLEKAATEGQLEALKRLPLAQGRGQRPMAFNPQALAGNGGTESQQLQKALFDGVDVSALGSNDERAHQQAAARAAGNFLLSGHFGKSVMDPSFKGAAGAK